MRLESRIAVAEVLDIPQVLLARQDGAVAQAWVGLGLVCRKASHQLGDHPRWDLAALPGVRESEQDQMAEQHAPVASESHQEALPIENAPKRADQVQHVGAIETLALLHECL